MITQSIENLSNSNCFDYNRIFFFVKYYMNNNKFTEAYAIREKFKHEFKRVKNICAILITSIFILF